MAEKSEPISILLVEYGALGEECFLRIKSRFTIMGYGGAVTAFLIAQGAIPPAVRCAVAVIAAISLMAIWFRFGQLIANCQRRLAEIEVKVNSLAGDDLLVWNSRIVPNGFFHRAHTVAVWAWLTHNYDQFTAIIRRRIENACHPRLADPDYCEEKCPICTRARQGNRLARFVQTIEMLVTFGGCPYGRARQRKYGVRPNEPIPPEKKAKP